MIALFSTFILQVVYELISKILSMDKMCSPETSPIEQLPDALLFLILSFLPTMAEMARTSILSRRWRHVWHNTTRLDFNATTRLDFNATHERLSDSHSWYIASINNIIKARAAMPLLPLVIELRIQYCLDKRHQPDIDRWIDFAIANRVETLHLVLGGYGLLLGKSQQCKLSEGMWYRAPSGLSSLQCLKSLSLSCVNVNKQFIEFILLNCTLLEDLSVHFSGGGTNEYLDVSGTPPLRLRRLKLDGEYEFLLTRLCAPNLTSFYCKSSMFNPQKIDVPMLSNLTIGSTIGSPHTITYLKHFWPYLPQLEKLELIMLEPHGFKFQEMPKLLQLKYLKMTVNWDTDLAFYRIGTFIEACPLLETFTLKLLCLEEIPNPSLVRRNGKKQKWWIQREKKWRLKVENSCSFQSLKVLKLYSFNEKIIDQEIVKCIISKAPNLEKLIVDTLNDTEYRVFFSYREETVKVVEAKAKELCEKRPQKIEITILG